MTKPLRYFKFCTKSSIQRVFSDDVTMGTRYLTFSCVFVIRDGF